MILTDVCQLFRIWLGVTEYLYRNEALLSEVIDTAINDHCFRSDDLEFTFAARVGLLSRGWHAPTNCLGMVRLCLLRFLRSLPRSI